MNIALVIAGRVANQLKSLVICIHATNPCIGLFNNLEERWDGPTFGHNEFKESDFMGCGRADNADVQFKDPFFDSVRLTVELYSILVCRKTRKYL